MSYKNIKSSWIIMCTNIFLVIVSQYLFITYNGHVFRPSALSRAVLLWQARHAIKKTDQRSNGKRPCPFIKHVLRNGRRKKTDLARHWLYAKKWPNTFLIHVFRGGEKYRLLLRGGPTYRKENCQQKYNLTVNATVTDP